MALTAEDRFEIQDLYARYAHSIDANDGEAYASCYTRDGVFVPSTGHIAGNTYQGREKLVALGNDLDREPPTRHWNCNYLLTERADHVEGTCYAMRIEIGGTEPVVAASAVYHDEIVKEDGQWKFRARRPKLDVQKYRATAGDR
ncbi:nuclear transport factor 2 family protein [Saccharomonospora sp. NPDC046836]|uniref:nuclear transport factor 2 family protein n=1 Tax=Saccharomonospora sp. NPDC046836 TaxID=3156921 RepID=UPI0033FB4CAD